MSLYGGIEGGGTKFVVGIGTAEGGSIATGRIETRDPATTLSDVAQFLADNAPPEGLAGIGLASFGPIALDRAAPGWGRMLATPKPGWQGADLPALLAERLPAALRVPIGLDTDVNAAALAEATLGAGRGRGDLAYATIGTGVGIGLVIDGRTVHGMAHPEGGHILPRRHPAHGDFAGICPFHGDCLEGLASGSAIRAAWGASLDALPADHPAWVIQADYLGQLCASLILMLAPATIVLGGGVMNGAALFPLVRARTAELLAGYARGADRATLDARITPAACREPPGLIGAYLLAANVGR